jgi:hypothetical protein
LEGLESPCERRRCPIVAENQGEDAVMGLAEHLKAKGKLPLPKPAWVRRPEVLLCPNVPKPMHGMAPREVLGSKWWNQTRQQAYRSTNYHCLACGVHKLAAASRYWLEGHELYSIDYAKGRMVYVETVPLCHYCHNFIHDGRLLALLDKGLLHQSKYVAILKHGDRILREAGLSRPSHDERETLIANMEIAPWRSWRLVVFGKLYPPRYKTFEAWKRAFQ